jgi:hypothetical protein
MEVLPNDIVRQFLLSVPYKWHDNLKGVCRSWESMVRNPEFYLDRKISGMTEQLLCLIQQDPSYIMEIRVCDPVKGTLARIPPINDPHFAGIGGSFQCAAMNQKLVLLGRWSRRADMPTPRYSFAYSIDSSTKLVYVAGGVGVYVAGRVGVDEPLNPLEEDKWEILPPMIQPHDLGCDGVFMEGKIMVFTEDISVGSCCH